MLSNAIEMKIYEKSMKKKYLQKIWTLIQKLWKSFENFEKN